jgi:hypothetical protein
VVLRVSLASLPTAGVCGALLSYQLCDMADGDMVFFDASGKVDMKLRLSEDRELVSFKNKK